MRITGSDLRKGAGYVLINFATPIAFFITFHEWGPKPAIALSIGVTFLQLLAHALYRIRPSLFFALASGFTVGFGTLDLWIQSPRFFRLEPFAQNFGVATFFLVTLASKVPTISYFLRALPLPLRPDLKHLGSSYLKHLTVIWIVYLYLKSFFFLYLAFHVNLANLIVIRSVFGGGTLFLLFIGELLYRAWRKKQLS